MHAGLVVETVAFVARANPDLAEETPDSRAVQPSSSFNLPLTLAVKLLAVPCQPAPVGQVVGQRQERAWESNSLGPDPADLSAEFPERDLRRHQLS
jgi:hypothetical protein